MDKLALRDRILEQLTVTIAALRASAEETRRGATHEESKPENDKDTRGLEASYLARGQAARVESLEEDETRLRFLALRAFGPDDPIDLGAVVTVEIDDDERHFFVVPCAGGMKVDSELGEVALLNPASPLGQALVGKLEGDEVSLRIAGGPREYVIASVR